MELRHLRYVLALAEECHFGRAAQRLHVAQSALSQQLKQLERELGTTLFTRSTRRVELTEAGRHLVAYARSILAEVERADEQMALLAAGRAGRVSIGFVGTATYDLLPQIARTVRAQLPDVALELRGELLNPELVEGLRNGTYDLALLRSDTLTDTTIAFTPLRTERLVAALPAGHRLAARSRIPLGELADEPFVVHPSRDRSSMHGRVLDACARAGFVPAPLIEVGETSTLVVFVAAGHGVALVPESVQSLALDGVAYAPLTETETVTLGLARRAQRHSPVTERVAAIVKHSIKR
ncbi:LysR family transcriptional regulator [Streptomyces fuscichromogenes]|uniref:LysR family transcriptional regulator n=1 Tax=Streptomyces fuscichromogenes TaxID=1324013 RepID=A0A917XJY3_9ACTN|nr:LysR family transcriptional regulator [Streptomyces fuscichromogenes]GGN33767.1 LysR family transcriptional regulator [Streptomyces fuscichromogenes]